jgi:hypothetical protein
VKTIPVTDTIHGGTLYVAITGKPYPLEIAALQGTKDVTITFTDWDKRTTVAAPKSAVALSG